MLGATIVHAMWEDARTHAQVISTDATGALIQPAKTKDGRPQACKKGHFFTAVADCDAVLFAYTEEHTSTFVQGLFGNFRGYLQADASNVYDVLENGRPKDSEDGVRLVGCFAHLRRYFFEAAICRYPAGLQGLLRIRAIYAADRVVQRAPATDHTMLRGQHVRPLVDDFFAWAHATKAVTVGRNLATKALGYATNQEAELRRVLESASCRWTTRGPKEHCERSSSGARRGCSTAATRTPRPPLRSSVSSPRAGCTVSTHSSTSKRSCGCCPTGLMRSRALCGVQRLGLTFSVVNASPALRIIARASATRSACREPGTAPSRALARQLW